MNNQAVVYMNTRRPQYTNTRRPQSRKTVVYSPTRKRRSHDAMLASAVEGFCYLALMVCLFIGITVLIALV